MIGIVVADMNESIRFYRTLGWEVADPEAGHPYHETTLPNGLRFSWNAVEMAKDIDPDYVEPVGYRMGMAFKCDSPADVDAQYARIVAAGFNGYKEPYDAFWGMRYAQLKDPDGNIVDVFAELG
ncbi:MAG TPA: VOC family protein [Fimbriimonas sp.]|nr:VOC family protein [Fimbriimonas sp.]